MAITETRRFNVDKSPEQVLKIVVDKMAQKQALFQEPTPQKMEFILGSGSKTRLLGGPFVSADTLPVKITFLMRGHGSTEVEITIQDNLGFGSRLGLKGKFTKYFHS